MPENAKKAVLLVEDEAILAMSEKMALEQYGYTVKTAATGEKAIEAVESDPDLDLILMDIDLGKGIDGTQAAEIILKDHDIPIVFVSSHSEREIVEKTEKITSYGYVVKSSSLTVLDASIKMAFKLFDAIKRERKKEEDLRESKKIIQKKLNALTQFETGIFDLELADIIDVETIQPLMDDFYVFTGFPVAIVDLAGKVLVQTGWQDICTKFHRMHPETLKNCLEYDTVLTRNVPAGEFKSYLCKNNLWDNVTPLMIGGNHIGNLFTGQFFYEGEKPDDGVFLSQAKKYGFDEKEYMEAMHRVPVWKKDVANIGLKFYAKLAHTISSLSLANLSLAKSLGEQKNTADTLRASESKWCSLVNAIPDFIGILDDENRFLFLNHYAEGFSEKDVAGKSVFEFLPPESRDAFREGIMKCRETQVIQRFEHTAAGDNNKMREYDDYIISIVNAAGISNIMIVSRDTTERKQTERALRISEERYRKILLSAMDGYWLTDTQGNILDVNESYCRMSGYSRQELLAMRIGDIVYPESGGEISDRIRRIIRNGSERFDSSHKRKDGSILEIEVSVHYLDIEGDHIVSFFRDITDRMKTAIALQTKNEEYEAITKS